jgi:hypothetical protein
MLAGAMTALSRGVVPWRDFDLTTIGPVTIWFLAGCLKLGMPASYQAIHILAASIWAATALMVILTGWILSGRSGGIFSFSIFLAVSLASYHNDYLHFTSELVPGLLLSISGLLLLKVTTSESDSKMPFVSLFAIGVLSSMAVFAKLQALPISAFFLLAAFFATIHRNNINRSLFFGLLGLFGAIIPVAVMIIWLMQTGDLMTGVTSYFLAGSSYGASGSLSLERIVKIGRSLMGGWWSLRPFGVLMTLAAVALIWRGWFPWPIRNQRVVAGFICVGWFGCALFAVLVPLFRWIHHGIFLIAPAIVFLTFLVSHLTSYSTNGLPWFRPLVPRIRNFVWILFVILWVGLGFPTIREGFQKIRQFQKNDAWQNKFPSEMADDVKSAIEKLSKTGDPIAIWGWAPEIFILSQRPSASRHVISHFLIDENPAKKMHRATFLQDLVQKPPEIFIDAVAEGFFTWQWGDGQPFRVSSFPELDSFLSNNYFVHSKLYKTPESQPVVIYKKSPSL